MHCFKALLVGLVLVPLASSKIVLEARTVVTRVLFVKIIVISTPLQLTSGKMPVYINLLVSAVFAVLFSVANYAIYRFAVAIPTALTLRR